MLVLTAGIQTDQPILFFKDEWSFLSNFAPSPVFYDGLAYGTVEHAFQAAKTLDHDQRILIAGETTPGRAKRAGRKVTLRTDWEDIKYGVMRTLVSLKFTANPDLAVKLLATGNRHLEEGNEWRDIVWGKCDGIGRNWLGLILMEIRGEIRALERAFENQRFDGEDLI